MRLFRKKEELTPEQRVTQRQISELKKLRRQEQMAKVQKDLGFLFRHSFPKGIRHPDSLVGNRHLYIPRRKGRTVLK